MRLERDIFALKQEIAERDDIIADKEKRLLELKRKNQELEKVKFVLEHKMEELIKQDEPRQAELLSSQEKIQVKLLSCSICSCLMHIVMHAHCT